MITGRRRAVFALLAVLIIAGGLAAGTGTARADGLDDLCKTVPAPVRPDYQVSGLVMDKPDLATVPNAAPDPFKDPTVPISDVYGWAWRFANYDLGCGNDFIRDPSAVATTASANFVLAWTATLNSWLASLEDMARSGVFDWLQGVVTSIADTLKDRVLTVWLPLAAIVLSIVVVFTSRTAGYADTMRRLAMLAGSVLLAVVTLVLPKQAMGMVDNAADTASGIAQAGFTSDAADLVTREAIYQTWLVGNFGSADSATAQEYGPRLMSALTYTWSDVKRMDADPTAKAKIDEAKATEFRAIAGEVEKKDPTAYQSLTGKTDTRTAPATLGVVWVILMGLFVAVACFMIVMAKLIMLGLILYGMVASVIGVVKYAVLQRVWDLFTAAVLNIVKFTLAAGLMTLVLGALSTAPVGVGWQMLLGVIATVIALMFTRPVRSFKAMAGLDPNRSVVGSALKRVVGAVAGHKVWESHHPDPSRSPAENGVGAETATAPQPVEPSYPPLPPPPPLRALPAAQTQPAIEGTSERAWAGYTAVHGRPRPLAELPSAPSAPVPTEVLPEERQRALPVAPVAAPLLAVPALSVAARNRQHDQGLEQPPATLLVSSVADDPGVALPPPPTLVPPPTPVAVSPPTVAAGSQPGAALGSDRREPAVVYPTGILLPADPSLYRSTERAATGDVTQYYRFSEPQVDEHGHETWAPIYHADKVSSR